MDKLWRKFSDLSGECYMNMIQSDEDKSIWDDTFAVMNQIVNEGRRMNQTFASELYQLDEISEYQCDINGWLEDYLDELDMYQQYDKLQEVCLKLIDMFQWEEESPSDYRFRIVSALESQGKIAEALAYCEDWFEKEPDNLLAATALIYAKIAVKDFDAAEQLVQQYITEDTDCTDENCIIFTAAEKLYQACGNKRRAKWVSEALEKYDQEINDSFMEIGEDDEEILDGLLPLE